MGELTRFANARFGLGWTPEAVMKRLPPQVLADLQQAQERFVQENVVEKTVAQAQACKTDDELAKWWSNRFGDELPATLRRVDADERNDAIRSKVEGNLRTELVTFERTVLLQVLDGIWREHLYAMDQLKESIGYRSFSQQDPRIEYKREGARMFSEMMDNIRERVTDLILKVELMPQMAQGMPGMAPVPSGSGGRGGGGGGGGGGNFGSSIAGPGFGR
jgi:preprotein translocase subunit SecA